VVLVHSVGTGENLEYSAIAGNSAQLVSASLAGIRRRYGEPYASPELYLATRMSTDPEQRTTTGLVRGVTPAALLVRHLVEITQGDWPGPGEILVGRLAAAKLGRRAEQLALGNEVWFEGRRWRISGTFAARDSVLESEMWCRLDDLQQTLKRQDLTLVALSLAPGTDFSEVDLFCKQRLDLELQAMRETDYYAMLNRHYRPVRYLAWLVAMLVAAAGVFAVLNMMYAAVAGRVRELATLETIGFLRRAIALSLVQEATLLSAVGFLAAAFLAIVMVHGMAIRFTMGAFQLRIDGAAMLAGGATALMLGVFGALPPAVHVMRRSVAESLKAV
jgi:ABC-type lipoprotein release transport system permease subunit